MSSVYKRISIHSFYIQHGEFSHSTSLKIPNNRRIEVTQFVTYLFQIACSLSNCNEIQRVLTRTMHDSIWKYYKNGTSGASLQIPNQRFTCQSVVIKLGGKVLRCLTILPQVATPYVSVKQGSRRGFCTILFCHFCVGLACRWYLPLQKIRMTCIRGEYLSSDTNIPQLFPQDSP